MELDRLMSSLVGMEVEEARSIVRANGYDTIVFRDRSPMAAVAYHNTLVLFELDGQVTTVMVGDPTMSNVKGK